MFPPLFLAIALLLAAAATSLAEENAGPPNPVAVQKYAVEQMIARDDPQAAIDVYTRVLERDDLPPDYRAAFHMDRGRFFGVLGQFELALKDADRALEVTPETSLQGIRGPVYAFKGFVLAELGRRDEAASHLQKALELLPPAQPSCDEPAGDASSSVAGALKKRCEMHRELISNIEQRLLDLQ